MVVALVVVILNILLPLRLLLVNHIFQNRNPKSHICCSMSHIYKSIQFLEYYNYKVLNNNIYNQNMCSLNNYYILIKVPQVQVILFISNSFLHNNHKSHIGDYNNRIYKSIHNLQSYNFFLIHYYIYSYNKLFCLQVDIVQELFLINNIFHNNNHKSHNYESNYRIYNYIHFQFYCMNLNLHNNMRNQNNLYNCYNLKQVLLIKDLFKQLELK